MILAVSGTLFDGKQLDAVSELRRVDLPASHGKDYFWLGHFVYITFCSQFELQRLPRIAQQEWAQTTLPFFSILFDFTHSEIVPGFPARFHRLLDRLKEILQRVERSAYHFS